MKLNEKSSEQKYYNLSYQIGEFLGKKQISIIYGGGKVDKQPYVKVRNSLSQWLESEQAYKDFDANPFDSCNNRSQ